MEWKEYKLGDVCEITSSKRIFYSEYEDSGVPFYRSKEIINLFNKQEIATELFISEERYKEIKEKFGVPQKNDILLTSVGSIGIPYLVKENDKFYFKDGNLTWIRNYDARKIDPLFLYIWIISEVGKRTLEILSMGAAQAALTISRLKEAKIFLPSINEQRAIASILSNYDMLIDINTKRIKLLEESARELYKEWFVRMRFPGYEKAKFVKGIPEGWKYMRIDENYKTGSGGTPSSSHNEYYNEGTINWIRTGELKDGFIFKSEIQITDKGLNNSSAKMYPPYSVIIAMYGNSIGQLGILSNPSSSNQARCVIQPKTIEYSWEFIYLSLIEYRQYLISFGFGAAQQNISQDEIKKFKIVFPKKEIAQSFTYMVHPLFKEIEALQLQDQTLASTRDRLLPRLLSGELKVKA